MMPSGRPARIGSIGKKIVTDLWCQLCLTFMVDQEINESCQPGFLHFIKLSHTLLD